LQSGSLAFHSYYAHTLAFIAQYTAFSVTLGPGVELQLIALTAYWRFTVNYYPNSMIDVLGIELIGR